MASGKAFSTTEWQEGNAFLVTIYKRLVVDTMRHRWYIDRASFQEEATDLEN